MASSWKWKWRPLSKLARNFASSALVVAEHGGGSVKNGSISAVAAAAAVLGDSSPVTLLLAGSGGSELDAAIQHASSAHPAVSQVLVARSPLLGQPLAEPWAELLVQAQKKGNYSHIFAASSSFGKDVLPRAAALLGVSPITDVTRTIDQHTYIRPIYAGNAMATVRFKGSGPCIVSIRATSFPAVPGLALTGVGHPSIVDFDASSLSSEAIGKSKWIGLASQQTERPELGAAKIVISGGRGLKSAENFELLEKLADKLGAAVGASRAAVDAGFVPNDMQIGQTGKIVAPELYIAVGISGAIQHLAGIKDSKVIVAINKDRDAPIFQVADYGLAMDLFEALPELVAKVPSKRL
ncbi:electron transfer flavoprotein subunit alpha, mitochondrial [Selaginella moellendorffii]|uniref:electron transfer flavoprotein subunit alpha, mitochondrial n=1 Tax=Selaginella moellendorffii TaxID=88036 RepID=UPI000D1C4C8A|nr:electron transfer flavoprotein subunit alpha, mitochondrial [Selaginella moellendorffii]|eukprot:XP_024540321.1 electron transfer flavoprotein subunit alpha, mitochondrial [Selaginella moellendorffii]